MQTNYFADSSPESTSKLSFPSEAHNLEGQIASVTITKGSTSDESLNTLDEPVLTTVKRDLKAVAFKFGHVIFPQKSQALLRDWDLWGPLALCIFVALMLQGSHVESPHAGPPEFTEVFVVTWFGACLVTLNIQLLRGTISFFQSLCVLGYCLLPLAVALLLCKIIVEIATQNVFLFVLRLACVLIGFFWAIFASHAFLSGYYPVNKKALAIYPVILFYFVVSWMILSHS